MSLGRPAFGNTPGSLADLRRAVIASIRPEPLDLTDPLVTSVLLDWPDEYRVRVVDEVVLGGAALYTLTRSLELSAMDGLLRDQGLRCRAGEVPAIVPLGLLGKAPLLDFSVEASNGNAVHLLNREETSRRQVDFLQRRAGGLDIDLSDDLLALLFGMSMFMPGMLDATKQAGARGIEAETAVLLEGSYERMFDAQATRRWLDSISAEAALLRAASGEPRDDQSSSENVLLALAEAPFSPHELTDERVEDLLGQWRAFLGALRRAGDTTSLQWLGVLGRRYVPMVDTVVDPARPLRITTTESRALPLRGEFTWNRRRLPARTYYCRLELNIRDAGSYHLRLRSDDDSVAIRDIPSLSSLDLNPIGSAYFAGLSPSDDGYALYSSDPDRPSHATARVPLRLSGDVRRALTLVGLLTVAALFVAALPVRLDKAAVGTITLPAAFAGTVLLVRERTTLSAKVLRTPKWGLVVVILALWAFALLRVSGAYFPVPVAPAAPPGASARPSAAPTTPSAAPATSTARPTRPSVPPATGRPVRSSPRPVPRTPGPALPSSRRSP